MKINGYSGKLAKEAIPLMYENSQVSRGRTINETVHFEHDKIIRLENVLGQSQENPPRGHVAYTWCVHGFFHSCRCALYFENSGDGSCQVYTYEGDGDNKTCCECMNLFELVKEELAHRHGTRGE